MNLASVGKAALNKLWNSALWWSGFKFGVFVGVLIGFVWMAAMLTIPPVLRAMTGLAMGWGS